MFNDRYSLTQGVIDGWKTMTRRIAEKVLVEDENCELGWNGEFKPARYKIGDVVAVAQSYENTGLFDVYRGAEGTAGWKNKMFVLAELMPHQIRITEVRRERLQDISEEDCLREGIYKAEEHPGVPVRYAFDTIRDQDGNILATTWFTSARGAFAGLIDKVCSKGTWESNPWVYVYTIELVK